MINTYQTSVAPPPLPPRHSRSYPILIPDPPSSHRNSKFLIQFLVAVVLLHLFLTVGGFLYLHHSGSTVKLPYAEGTAKRQSADRLETPNRTLARMVVEQPHPLEKTFKAGLLRWDMSHSFRRNINYYNSSWLTILDPGDYNVYSKVSFSSSKDLQFPLACKVKMRETESGGEKTVMQAYCTLDNLREPKIPHLCSASQSEVLTLDAGNQLSVWVQDLSTVTYEEGANTFGMYKL